jgi:rubredoxin
MSFLLRQVAHCDVCGHEWLTSKVPSHCAKCKSRKWNQVIPAYVEVTPQQLKTHQAAMSREPLGSGNVCPDCGGLKGLHQKGCKPKRK